MAGLSILFAVATLYFFALSGATHVQYASTIVLARSLREVKTAITNDVQSIGHPDLLKRVDSAIGKTEMVKKRAGKIVVMSSVHSLTGLLSLAIAIGSFYGKPRIAAWIALAFGLCAGLISCMWI
jgi:hypothetical protein